MKKSCLLFFVNLVAISVLVAENQVVTLNTDAHSGTGGEPGDLRYAIENVGVSEEITFSLAFGYETITLQAELTIDKSLSIDADNTAGSGTDITINGAGTVRVFNIPSGNVTLENMKLNNSYTSSNGGGGIYIHGADLTLNNVSISNSISSGVDGGGIFIESGSLVMTNCTLSSNECRNGFWDTYGGGIAVASGASLTITGSTISGNSAGSNGGGIYNAGLLTINNSTVSDNSCNSHGGGVYNAGVLNINNSSISQNSAINSGGGIYHHEGTVNVKNSIIAQNTNNDDYYKSGGALADNGYNIVEYSNVGANSGFDHISDILFNTKYGEGGTSFSSWTKEGSDVSGSLNLATVLADNGGPTKTLAISRGSFAIGAGLYDESFASDQRGESRYNPPTIGAYEYQGINITWTGAASTVWETAGNWNGGSVPLLQDNVIVPSGISNYPVISSSSEASCNDLEVANGASLTINDGGSLITNGTITNNGSVAMLRTITDSKWHLISIPCNGIKANTFLGDYLQSWDEITHSWTDIVDKETVLDTKTGYGLWGTPDKATYTYIGTPLTGNQSKPVTFTEYSSDPEAFEGANLLGNPYPSSIDWSGLDDTYGAVYYWNGSAYVSWNDGSGAGTAYIPPMQGFFVVTTTNGTFNVGNANRTHSGASSYYKSSATLSGGLVLFADNGSYQDELWLMQHDNQTAGFELHADAYKFMSNTPGISQLWSVCPEGNLSIDVRPYQETIQLGFANDTPGFYSIGISQMADITTAILEDTKNNIFHDLTKGDYEFAWDLADDEGRFVLHLGVTGIEQAAQQENLLIYASGKTICLKPLQATTSGIFTLTDMSGRRIVQKELHLTGQTSVSVNVTPGIYLASFTSEGSIVVKKVIIN